jgi:hypothetical protein
MTRRASTVVLALMFMPTPLQAQDSAFTVTVPSADVHAGPSTVNPVIGHVSQGTVLSVSRNLGSWIRIPWPDAPDGIGYVHVTMGRLGATVHAAGASTPAPPPETRAVANQPAVSPPSTAKPTRLTRPFSRTPASHLVGVGGLVTPMSSVGGTARVWYTDHLGIQFGLTREATTSAVAAGRVTSLQFEPGVVYALSDWVTDYVWIRPYVGSAMSLQHQTLTVADIVAVSTASDTGVGVRVFAGSELTFSTVPRFGLSVDLAYRRFPTPFPGFEADALGVSIAGHWYIK